MKFNRHESEIFHLLLLLNPSKNILRTVRFVAQTHIQEQTFVNAGKWHQSKWK